MPQILETILYFLVALGVLIFVHELGHFLVARWYGVRVLTFSLGFGPKILKVKRGDTEYCISAVPLGGYVKMAGETVQDERQGAPDEFLSKSKWVRFQVYLAGPAMNIVLAVAAMTVVLSRGADIAQWISAPPVVGVVEAGSVAEKAGIVPGDRIVSVNGRDVGTWDDLNMAVLPKANRQVALVVDRNGHRRTVDVVPAATTKYDFGVLGVEPTLRPQITDVHAGFPAEAAGFKRGDVILGIDGKAGLDRRGLIEHIQQRHAQSITFEIERDRQPMQLAVIPVGSTGAARVGITISDFEVTRIDPSLPQAFKMSLEQNWAMTKQIGETLKHLFTGEARVNQLMGPVAIAELSGNAARYGWIEFLKFLAMISLNLALINLLPVPVLDGGQIAILALEGVARRDMNLRVKEAIAIVGAVLIVALMVTVIYNDVARLMR